MTIQQAFQNALLHHRADRLAEAEALYRQVLAVEPRHAHALQMLGVLAHQTGHDEAAAKLLGEAAALRPEDAACHSNLSEVLRGLGRLDEAIASSRTAIDLQPSSAAAHFNLGNALKDQGRLPDAVAAYSQTLRLKPDHADAHNNLGTVFQDLGKLDDAAACFRRALALKPDFAQAQNNLGVALKEQGKLAEAIDSCRRAIALAPGYAAAHHNLGNILRELGKLEEAAACYLRTLELQPGLAEPHHHLGLACKEMGKLEDAVACCRRALALQPKWAEAHSTLGDALREQGKLEEAVLSCRRALELQPDLAEAQNNLGSALRDQGKWDEATVCFRRALELQPGLAEAHSNLGGAFNDEGRTEEAIACCRRALELQPNLAEALNNLGNAYIGQRKLEAAVDCFHRALALKPGLAGAHNNLGNALLDQGKLDEAAACYGRALELNPNLAGAYIGLGNAYKNQCRLDDAVACYRRALDLKPDLVVAHSNLVYTHVFRPGSDAQTLREALRQWNQQHAAPLAKLSEPHHNDRSPHRRLRIGYVSPDFVDHAIARFIAPLFEAHDHERFEIHAYSNARTPDGVTERLRQGVDRWHDIAGWSDTALATQIRADQIDLLIDLAMHTADNRLLLFARKPAPIQVTWLAYPGGTGLSAIDYRLTDPFLETGGEDAGESQEEPIQLPESWICYQPHGSSPEPAPLPAHRLGAVTFGSLNNFCKINDRTLALWARILASTKNSRLALMAKRGSHRDRTRAFLQDLGVSGDRVDFADYAPTESYLHQYDRIDIALDPFPCNGVTTSCDALWMGAPLVTLIGPMAAGRAGWSLLANIGLAECAAHSEDEYAAICEALAADLPKLAKLRQTLRRRMISSPLMDAARFAGNLEAAYRKMWQRWCAK